MPQEPRLNQAGLNLTSGVVSRIQIVIALTPLRSRVIKVNDSRQANPSR